MKERLRTIFLGKRLEDAALASEKFNVLWGIPVFASDAISSVSYAGEEILLVLIPVLGMASFGTFLPIVAAIIALLGILVFCYRQTIDAYPQGGGLRPKSPAPLPSARPRWVRARLPPPQRGFPPAPVRARQP